MRRYLWVATLMIVAGSVGHSVWAGEPPVVGSELPAVAQEAILQGAPLDAQRQAVPNTMGPFDYAPASPSDELRDGVSAPIPQLEESPLPAPSPLNNDNRG